jgi:hypothetical protein
MPPKQTLRHSLKSCNHTLILIKMIHDIVSDLVTQADTLKELADGIRDEHDE